MRKYRTIYTDHQSGDRVETEENKAEKIRLRKKLMTVVGCILIIGIVTPGSLAVKAAKRMIHEQAETVLIEQAKAAADMPKRLPIHRFLRIRLFPIARKQR